MSKKPVRVNLEKFEELYESNPHSFKDMILTLKNEIGNNNAIVLFEDENGNYEKEHYFDTIDKFEIWIAENYILNEGDEDGFFK